MSGLSYFLDAFQTGASAGPGVFYGAALMSNDGPAAIQHFRSGVAPFAAVNEQGNAFIEISAACVSSRPPCVTRR